MPEEKINMQDWEFLLQREGEESWQPITERYLELVEGTYRVVGFCKQPDLDVEIRVTFQSQEEGRCLRRSQRSRRTDGRGLFIILPSTELKQGIWEFHCSQSRSTEELPQLASQILTVQVCTAPEIIHEIPLPTDEVESYSVSEFLEDLWASETTAPEVEKENEGDANPIPAIVPEIEKVPVGATSKNVKTASRQTTEKSIAIDLFDPRKVEIAVRQITPSIGQIVPPRITEAMGNSSGIPQLPKFSFTLVEEFMAVPEVNPEGREFIDLENLEDFAEFSEDPEREELIEEQFQSLHLKEKFWSKVNKIGRD
jgi:hypothetical protein